MINNFRLFWLAFSVFIFSFVFLFDLGSWMNEWGICAARGIRFVSILAIAYCGSRLAFQTQSKIWIFRIAKISIWIGAILTIFSFHIYLSFLPDWHSLTVRLLAGQHFWSDEVSYRTFGIFFMLFGTTLIYVKQKKTLQDQ